MRSIFSSKTLAVYRPKADAPPVPADEETVSHEEALRNAKLAGVPLPLLLSERSNPGALLRDMLMHQPPDCGH